MFENLIAALKADKRKIVFTEGPDARILEAAARLKKDGLMDSILLLQRAASISRAWRSSTRLPIRRWTLW